MIFWIRTTLSHRKFNGQIHNNSILENQMIPFVNDVSTVDAPVGQWSQTNKITVMQRPVQSPDLNPIKNLSKQLDNKVRLHGRFRNRKELYRLSGHK